MRAIFYNKTHILFVVLTLLYLVPISFAGVNLNLLEFIVIMFGILVLFIRYANNNIKILNNRQVLWFLIVFLLFLVEISIGLSYASNRLFVLRELFKWSELFFIALIIHLYVRKVNDFKIIYLLFTLIVFLLLAQSIIHALIISHERVRIGAATVFILASILPFYKLKSIKFLLALIIVILIMTQSRAVWLASIIVFAISIFTVFRSSKLKVFSLVIISVVSIIFIFGLDDMISSRLLQLNIYDENTVAYSTLQRLYRIKISYYAFLDSPIFGVGAGNLIDYFYRSSHADLTLWVNWIIEHDKSGITPHNIFIQTLGELGIIGFVLLCALLLLCFKIINKTRSNRFMINDPWINGLNLSFIVLIIFFSLGYIAGQERLIFGMFFGLIISTPKYEYFNVRNLGELAPE